MVSSLAEAINPTVLEFRNRSGLFHEIEKVLRPVVNDSGSATSKRPITKCRYRHLTEMSRNVTRSFRSFGEASHALRVLRKTFPDIDVVFNIPARFLAASSRFELRQSDTLVFGRDDKEMLAAVEHCDEVYSIVDAEGGTTTEVRFMTPRDADAFYEKQRIAGKAEVRRWGDVDVRADDNKNTCDGGGGDDHHHHPTSAVEAEIVNNLTCPLSGAYLVTRPVVAEDGLTYELQAISEWVGLFGTSPVTHAPMRLSFLPNHVIRHLSVLLLVRPE